MDGRRVNHLHIRKCMLSATAVLMASAAVFAATAILMIPAPARAQAMGKASLDSGGVAPEGIAPAQPAPAPAAVATPISPPADKPPAADAPGAAPRNDKVAATAQAPGEGTSQEHSAPVSAAAAAPADSKAAAAPEHTSAAATQASIPPPPASVGVAPGLAVENAGPPMPMQVAGMSLELRINGDGYFCVKSPASGEVFYTKIGEFVSDANGALILAGTNLVLDPPISFPYFTSDVRVSSDGAVSAHAEYLPDRATLGQMLLTRFADPAKLRGAGPGLYQETAASGKPINAIPGAPGMGTLKQGGTATTATEPEHPALAATPAHAGPAPQQNTEKTTATQPDSSIENQAIHPAITAADSQKSGTPAKTSTQAADASSGWFSQLKGLAQVVGAMAVVIGLIFIFKGLAKKFVPGAKAAGGKGVIEVLARHPIAKNQAIVLVRIGSQIVALNQGRESSESVLVISEATEVAKIIGQIEGKKPQSSQAGFTKLLANARVDLERDESAEPDLSAISPENLDEQLEEMAAAKRQLMELRQHVRSVRDRLPKS